MSVGPQYLVPGLALLLAAAGAVKLIRPAETARALSGDPRPPVDALRRWGMVVRAGAAMEVGAGLWALLAGGRGADGLVALGYLGFAVFVAGSLLAGRAIETCGCFGEPDTPPTWSHAAFCLGAATAAALAGLAGRAPSLPHELVSLGGAAPGFLLANAALAYAGYLLTGPGPRLRAARRLATRRPPGDAPAEPGQGRVRA